MVRSLRFDIRSSCCSEIDPDTAPYLNNQRSKLRGVRVNNRSLLRHGFQRRDCACHRVSKSLFSPGYCPKRLLCVVLGADDVSVAPLEGSVMP
jgi:acyl-[acyl carrier protein]--UDP-N-acetylglucosamine O-acyltransferase